VVIWRATAPFPPWRWRQNLSRTIWSLSGVTAQNITIQTIFSSFGYFLSCIQSESRPVSLLKSELKLKSDHRKTCDDNNVPVLRHQVKTAFDRSWNSSEPTVHTTHQLTDVSYRFQLWTMYSKCESPYCSLNRKLSEPKGYSETGSEHKNPCSCQNSYPWYLQSFGKTLTNALWFYERSFIT